jgi:DNA-binding transcriptional ArsR family regulator
MADPFDPDNLKLPGVIRATPPTPQGPPRHRSGQKFLKGPIPLAWLEIAGRLPGKALLVGLHVWFQAGLRNSRSVPLNQSRLARPGMSDKTVRRGLRALERAGLVTVDRKPGRKPIVTLLDPPAAVPPTGVAPARGSRYPRGSPAPRTRARHPQRGLPRWRR